MTVVPPNNLPPESQPWARNRDEAIRQLQYEASRSTDGVANAFTGVNNTLTALSKQIADIAQVQQEQAAVQAQLVAQSAQLSAQQTALTATVANLASRVSLTTSNTSFNTGTLPNDSSDHFYGAPLSVNINVPTGQLMVTIGCGQATVNAGTAPGGFVTAECTFEIPGIVNYYDVYARVYNGSQAVLAGSSMVVTRSFTVPPGVHTITGYMSAYSAATGGSVHFSQPYMTVQVTG